MIVLNENDWAKEHIISNDIGKKPSETLRRVARFYLDENFKPDEVRDKLDRFIVKCDPSASLPKWSDALDYALKRAIKHEAINIKEIEITDKELKKINQLKGKQLKRFAFTLLCLAKYWKCVFPNNDYWVNNKDNEIMALANIKTSLRRQANLYWILKEEGMIELSKKVDNTNVRVCFAEDGNVVLRITDLRNLGYQYLLHHNEPFFKCCNCGIIEKIQNPSAGRKQLYCKKCATEIAIQQRINSVMRFRFGTVEKNDTLQTQ